MGDGGVTELISLIRAKEQAQAALAAAAAQHAERLALEAKPSQVPAIQPDGDTITGVAVPPLPRCGKVRRVAKTITSRGCACETASFRCVQFYGTFVASATRVGASN